MRITAEAKEETRRKILDAAAELFRSRGFDATTTRDIAREAGIAAGTLFNYFVSKEAIVARLAETALAKGRTAFARQAIDGNPEEELFALAAAELRQLKPLRKFFTPLLETVLSPLAAARGRTEDDCFRAEHLELVAGIARKHGVEELSPVSFQVYWALYTGVLAFWAADKSPRQEDTLAMLDRSMRMFAASLAEGGETNLGGQTPPLR
jgi:AcrR family transcriptional regulator